MTRPLDTGLALVWVAIGICSIALAVASNPSAESALAQQGSTSDAVAASQSLALQAEPPPSRGALAPAYVGGAAAREAADRRAALIPVPEGGNFNGVQWEVAHGAVIASADIEQVLEYNAACQWLRAFRDGRSPNSARRLLSDVSRWPALRTGSVAELWRAVAEDLDRRESETVAGVLRGCDESVARERDYATKMGRSATR